MGETELRIGSEVCVKLTHGTRKAIVRKLFKNGNVSADVFPSRGTVPTLMRVSRSEIVGVCR